MTLAVVEVDLRCQFYRHRKAQDTHLEAGAYGMMCEIMQIHTLKNFALHQRSITETAITAVGGFRSSIEYIDVT